MAKPSDGVHLEISADAGGAMQEAITKNQDHFQKNQEALPKILSGLSAFLGL